MASSSLPPIALAGTSLTLDEAIAAFAGLDRQCEFTDIAACLPDAYDKQLDKIDNVITTIHDAAERGANKLTATPQLATGTQADPEDFADMLLARIPLQTFDQATHPRAVWREWLHPNFGQFTITQPGPREEALLHKFNTQLVPHASAVGLLQVEYAAAWGDLPGRLETQLQSLQEHGDPHAFEIVKIANAMLKFPPNQNVEPIKGYEPSSKLVSDEAAQEAIRSMPREWTLGSKNIDGRNNDADRNINWNWAAKHLSDDAIERLAFKTGLTSVQVLHRSVFSLGESGGFERVNHWMAGFPNEKRADFWQSMWRSFERGFTQLNNWASDDVAALFSDPVFLQATQKESQQWSDRAHVLQSTLRPLEDKLAESLSTDTLKKFMAALFTGTPSPAINGLLESKLQDTPQNRRELVAAALHAGDQTLHVGLPRMRPATGTAFFNEIREPYRVRNVVASIDYEELRKAWGDAETAKFLASNKFDAGGLTNTSRRDQVLQTFTPVFAALAKRMPEGAPNRLFANLHEAAFAEKFEKQEGVVLIRTLLQTSSALATQGNFKKTLEVTKLLASASKPHLDGSPALNPELKKSFFDEWLKQQKLTAAQETQVFNVFTRNSFAAGLPTL